MRSALCALLLSTAGISGADLNVMATSESSPTPTLVTTNEVGLFDICVDGQTGASSMSLRAVRIGDNVVVKESEHELVERLAGSLPSVFVDRVVVSTTTIPLDRLPYTFMSVDGTATVFRATSLGTLGETGPLPTLPDGLDSSRPIQTIQMMTVFGDTGAPTTKGRTPPLSEIRFLDEDGHLTDFLLPSAEFERKSIEYILGHILDYCRRTITDRKVEIVLHIRDTRPTAQPEPRTLRGEEMLRIFREPDAPRAFGTHYVAWNRETLSGWVRILAMLEGVESEKDTHSDKAVLTFHLGPAEFTDVLKRKAYLAPEALRPGFAELPRRLSRTGRSAAYDPDTFTLVVIDDGAVFEILAATGCKLLYESKGRF